MARPTTVRPKHGPVRPGLSATSFIWSSLWCKLKRESHKQQERPHLFFHYVYNVPFLLFHFILGLFSLYPSPSLRLFGDPTIFNYHLQYGFFFFPSSSLLVSAFNNLQVAIVSNHVQCPTKMCLHAINKPNIAFCLCSMYFIVRSKIPFRVYLMDFQPSCSDACISMQMHLCPVCLKMNIDACILV